MKRWCSLGWFVAIAIVFALLLPVKGWIFVGAVVGFLTFIFITFHAGINLKEWWDET